MRAGALLCVAVGLAAQSPLEPLAWMAGCWESANANRSIFEMWSPPAGGMMVGIGRTVVGGRARAFDRMRMEVAGDGIVYTAFPSGQAEASFPSTAISADGFTVENPEHDFPTRITYRREGRDTMTARVEGPGPNGPRGFDVRYQRIRCEAPLP